MSKEIPLTKGYVAIVDDDWYEMLSKVRWGAEPGSNIIIYARNSTWDGSKTRKSRMHTVIMDPPKGMQVDHINGNGLDNRRCNLRLCTHHENQKNMGKKLENPSSSYKGVCWHKRARKWMAQIEADGKHIYLGLFENEKEAALAFNDAAIKYRANFARLNVI